MRAILLNITFFIKYEIGMILQHNMSTKT